MSRLRQIIAAVRARLSKIWSARVEHLQAGAVLVGWGLLWWGLSDVLGRWVAPRGVQAIGAGLLVLSCVGWKVLRLIATVGLYSLSKADRP